MWSQIGHSAHARTVWIELLPDLVEEVVVLVGDALLDVLCGLRVVFQDHSDVHVDDDEEAENEVYDHECDAGHVVAAVARVSGLRVRQFAVGLVGDGRQGFGPSGRRAHLEVVEYYVFL